MALPPSAAFALRADNCKHPYLLPTDLAPPAHKSSPSRSAPVKQFFAEAAAQQPDAQLHLSPFAAQRQICRVRCRLARHRRDCSVHAHLRPRTPLTRPPEFPPQLPASSKSTQPLL